MLKLDKITKQFDKQTAVDQISLHISKGEVYGLVGESGSGKSTIGNMIIGLIKPTSGQIKYGDLDLWQKGKFYRPKLGKMQIVFQDPQSSLDPRMQIRDIITEPLRIFPAKLRKEKVNYTFLEQLLNRVGLHKDHLTRYPHEFSGGQRQRIAIARALITDPEFVILDEPTSALDVSVQAQILNLLTSLQKERDLTYLFISHDMSVIRYMCDRIGVLYHGRLIEEEETETLFTQPKHEYTKTLLSSLPRVTDKREDKVNV